MRMSAPTMKGRCEWSAKNKKSSLTTHLLNHGRWSSNSPQISLFNANLSIHPLFPSRSYSPLHYQRSFTAHSLTHSISLSPSPSHLRKFSTNNTQTPPNTLPPPNEKEKEKRVFGKIQWDMGLRGIGREWKELLKKGSPAWEWENIKRDFIAGITIPSIAIPVSLGAALMSGVPVYWGLTSAIIGAAIYSFFGGSRLVISGPATGMSVVVFTIVQNSGLEGLILATMLTGGMQVATGVFGLGSIMKCVPLPVIWGFTSGLGAIIFQKQLKQAFELPFPVSSLLDHFSLSISSIQTVIEKTIEMVGNSNPTAGLISSITLLACLIVPKYYPRFPIAISTIAVFTTLQMMFGCFGVSLLGQIPDTFPDLKLPSFDNIPSIGQLMADSSLLYFMSSIQAMLSISAADKIAKLKGNMVQSNTNQDFIGQGLSNVGCSLFTTMPSTGLVVQSTLSIMTGAKTRRAGLVHALTLTSSIYLFASTMQYIPLSSLSAVLMSVAMTMIKPSDFLLLNKIDKKEATVWLVTLATVFVEGIMVGSAVGLSLSLLFSALSSSSSSKTPFFFSLSSPSPSLPSYQFLHSQLQAGESESESGWEGEEKKGKMKIIKVEGGASFLSALSIERLGKVINEGYEGNERVIVDMRDLRHVDATAGEQFALLFNDIFQLHPSSFHLLPPPPQSLEAISHFDSSNVIPRSSILPPIYQISHSDDIAPIHSL